MRMLMRTALLSLVAAAAAPSPTIAQPAPATQAAPAAQKNGQQDFDWEIGAWKTQLKRRLRPLTGSNEWVEYEGTTIVREALDGRANLAELEVRGPHGRIEGVSLRLYNPQAGQWALHYANIANGTLTLPVIGAFSDGRGEFYAADTLDGRSILVRFVISDITADSAHFEQAYSADGGKTWETNWIATDTRTQR